MLGKGAFLRLLFREPLSAGGVSSTGTLVVLPAAGFIYDYDPNCTLMTEAKFQGDYWAPTTASHLIRVDLRRRRDPVSLDALGLMNAYFDAVVLEIGNSEKCHVFRGMTRAPYSLMNPMLGHVREGFSLRGGCRIHANVDVPTWARASESSPIPRLAGYTRTGVTIPSGF